MRDASSSSPSKGGISSATASWASGVSSSSIPIMQRKISVLSPNNQLYYLAVQKMTNQLTKTQFDHSVDSAGMCTGFFQTEARGQERSFKQ